MCVACAKKREEKHPWADQLASCRRPRGNTLFSHRHAHTHAHPECSGKVVGVSWKMSVNVVEMCEIFLSIFVATDWHCVGIFAACPCFKWIRLRLRATSQGSLNLCGTGTRTCTVDDRSVGIGIGLPTTFSGSGNARATMTFPPNGLRWRATGATAGARAWLVALFGHAVAATASLSC